MSKNVQFSLWLAALTVNLGVIAFFAALLWSAWHQHDFTWQWSELRSWFVFFVVPTISLLGLWTCRPSLTVSIWFDRQTRDAKRS